MLFGINLKIDYANSYTWDVLGYIRCPFTGITNLVLDKSSSLLNIAHPTTCYYNTG